MSLIDSSYFNFEINVDTDDDYSDMTNIIARYEPEILRRLLGYDLAKSVMAYANPGSTQAIIDLVDGKEYTNGSGQLVKWIGLKNSEKISLIAYYVFYWYAKNRATMSASLGELKPATENAQQVSAADRVSGAWLRLRELYEDAYCFLSEHEQDYPEWVFQSLGSVNSFNL